MGHDPVIAPISALGGRFPETAREAALAFVRSVADGHAPTGQWQEFGEGLRGVCLVAGAASANVLEYHRANTDIHLTVRGCDRMHVGSADAETEKPYDPATDFGLVKATGVTVFDIGPDQFLEIAPGVPHINLLDAGSVKIVFKIPAHG
jgi:beta-galactosidase beta subunit